MHSLTKSAIFVTVGHAAHIAGTQAIDHIRGLIRTQPAVGWGLLIGIAAIAGFPPFGVFTSEFLLLTATMKSCPWLTLALLLGLGGRLRRAVPAPAPDGLRRPPPEGQQPVAGQYVAGGWSTWCWCCGWGSRSPASWRWLDQATG